MTSPLSKSSLSLAAVLCIAPAMAIGQTAPAPQKKTLPQQAADPPEKAAVPEKKAAEPVVNAKPEKKSPDAADIRYKSKTDWHMVAIEALVVEVNEERTRQLGFKYGVTSEGGGSFDGADVQLGPQGSVLAAVPLLNKGAEGQTGVGFGSRMPGFGISLVGIDLDSTVLAARLRALLNQGEAVIRTRPIGVALNKTEVVIETVEELPYADVDARGKLGIQKKATGVKLKVTPTISTDYPGAVTLDISNIEISSGSNFITLQNVNRPVVNVSRTHTQLTLREGETFVIGGLKTRRKTVEKESVPILGSIPGLKWLFTSTSEVERNMDVLFFITPKILEPGENFLLPYDFENRKLLGQVAREQE